MMFLMYAFYFLHTSHFGYVTEEAFNKTIAQHLCTSVYTIPSPYQRDDGASKIEVCELL